MTMSLARQQFTQLRNRVQRIGSETLLNCFIGGLKPLVRHNVIPEITTISIKMHSSNIYGEKCSLGKTKPKTLHLPYLNSPTHIVSFIPFGLRLKPCRRQHSKFYVIISHQCRIVTRHSYCYCFAIKGVRSKYNNNCCNGQAYIKLNTKLEFTIPTLMIPYEL